MLNLNKLKPQFNLKDIDVADLSKTLLEHQGSLIKLILIIGSLLIVGAMFNGHRLKDQGLRARISQAREKLGVLKARDAARGELDNFKSSLPHKINEFELITLISNYAKSHHVSINSLSPAESQDMGLYDAINVSFNAVAGDFKDMMLFLRNIEKSEFPLRINSWTGHEGDNGQIAFQIEISAVLIHT
jgi:hypothetical protein